MYLLVIKNPKNYAIATDKQYDAINKVLLSFF